MYGHKDCTKSVSIWGNTALVDSVLVGEYDSSLEINALVGLLGRGDGAAARDDEFLPGGLLLPRLRGGGRQSTHQDGPGQLYHMLQVVGHNRIVKIRFYCRRFLSD
jgi:hypothetical protein